MNEQQVQSVNGNQYTESGFFKTSFPKGFNMALGYVNNLSSHSCKDDENYRVNRMISIPKTR